MKKYLLLFIMTSFIIIATACGATGEDQNTNEQTQGNQTETPAGNNNTNDNGSADNNQNTNQNENQGDMQSKMDELNYTDFQLDIEYANDETYEAELKTEDQNQRIDADLEDDLNGVKLDNEQAFDELYPLVEQLSIDQNTSKEDAIADVINTFNLPADYQEFDMEITFKDGPKVEYEDKK